jgi:serine/threonine-protein kinase OSR1/STK39
MIEQCLQKNPADRPTAKQLLKHDFFKKAKDRSYIAKHLALKFQDRKKMEEKTVNRRKPPSVRAVRVSDSGEWKFSSGSDDENTSGNDTTSVDDAANKLKQLENQTVKNMGDLIEKNNLAIKSNESTTTQSNVNEVTAGVKELSTDNNQVLKLTLRIRFE